MATTYVATEHHLGVFRLSAPLSWVVLYLLLPLLFAADAFALSFFWTGYRLANAEQRGKMLWIVLGALFGFPWIVFAVALT